MSHFSKWIFSAKVQITLNFHAKISSNEWNRNIQILGMRHFLPFTSTVYCYFETKIMNGASFSYLLKILVLGAKIHTNLNHARIQLLKTKTFSSFLSTVIFILANRF